MSFVVGFVGGELIPHIIAHLLVDSFWGKAQDRTCAARPSALFPPVPQQQDRVRRAVPRTDPPPVGLAPIGITIRSSLPGRARFAAIALRHQPLRARTVEATLRRLPGLRSVTITAATGSVLVHYDPDAITLARLVATVTDAIRDEPSLSGRASAPVAA